MGPDAPTAAPPAVAASGGGLASASARFVGIGTRVSVGIGTRVPTMLDMTDGSSGAGSPTGTTMLEEGGGAVGAPNDEVADMEGDVTT